MEERLKSEEITIGVFWKVFCRRLPYLLVALLVGLGLALGYSKLIAKPSYSSTAKFLVINTSNSANVTSSSYQQGAESFAANYVLLLQGNVFNKDVVNAYVEATGKAITVEQVQGKLLVEHETDTSSFTVTLKSRDAQEAYDLLLIYQELAPEVLNEQNDFIEVKLISEGAVDTVPDSPNTKINMILGGFSAVLLVYIAFFLIHLLDKTIYQEEDIKENFNVPVLGEIPSWVRAGEDVKNLARDRKQLKRELFGTQRVERDVAGRLLSKETVFSITEAFKTLRTNLMYAGKVGDGAPVLGVVSDFSGAGKSLVASNVAIGFSQLGKKVLLIDADMRCPIQHRSFNISRYHNGLSEALAGLVEDPLKDCVFPTAYEGLDLITCGRIPPNPNELLCSQQMKDLIKNAREAYDYVVVDLPPVCATSDAGVLASLLSGYLLVARVGYSNLSAMRDSLEILKNVNANVLGVVLNDVDVKFGTGYYAKRRGYHHRYYANPTETGNTK